MKKLILGVMLCAATMVAVAVNPPLMGWSSWNAYGFKISESIIKAQADAMVELGFYDCGYNHINIDDGFFGGRDENGKLLIHPTRFPNGLRPLVDYIHSCGLKAGIYSDAGRNTCASYWGGDEIGVGVGLYGHDEQDMNLYFNELDFDFIKIDYCGADAGNNSEGLDLDVEARYKEIYEAINSTGRTDITWNLCRWAFPGTWACDIANSWRTTEDIYLGWASVKSIINQSLYLSAYAGNGRYNDMDMLEVGRGLTDEEDKTHFGMWCVMSSPLLIGCDLNDIKGDALALMQNKELIAVNQDVLGLQAYVVKKENGAYVLVKDVEVLNGTKRVVAFYNPTDTEQQMSIAFSDLDLAGDVAVRDLFEKKDRGLFSGALAVAVPAHGTRIYKLTAEERLERSLYEAETAWLTCYQELENHEAAGTAMYLDKSSCSGGVAVGWLGGNEENDLQWRNVYSKEGGEYTLRFSFISGENRKMLVSVNDGTPVEVTTNGGSWSAVGTVDVNVTLNKGNNVVRLYNRGWMGDIDCMKLIPKNVTEDVDYYPVVFDKTMNYTHGSRRLNSVSLNGSADGNQKIDMPTPLKIYSKVDGAAFTAMAGESLTPVFGFTGNWMNGFVYLDRGQDGAFDAVLNEDGTYAADSDIMAFSYAEHTLNSGVGYNSTGVRVTNADVLNPPSFTLPADLANGMYLMRYKVDWASIDPAGRTEDGNGIIKNGGAICDVCINVHGESGVLSVVAENGALLAADGSALPATVPFGKPLELKVVPAVGYVLDVVKVRHGHNLTGDAEKFGVKQYSDDLIPAYMCKDGVLVLPAEYVDGDVQIEALFAEAQEDALADGYAVSFDKEAVAGEEYNGVLALAVGLYDYNTQVTGSNVYIDMTDVPVVLSSPRSFTLSVDDNRDGLHYYLYIDWNNDGRFTALLNSDGLPSYSSELVAFTQYNGKDSNGNEVAAPGKVLPLYKLPNNVHAGVYRARVKADVNDVSPAGSAAIVANNGVVVDFLINIVTGTCPLNLNTLNGSIIAPNNSALPMAVSPMSELQFQLMPGAPGFEASEVVVRHGHNIKGEQYVNGNKQWSEEVMTASADVMTLPAEYVDGEVEIIAKFANSTDSEWQLVFSDEFNAADGTQPANQWWSRCQRQGATWNRWLSDREEVVYIEDGKLVTRAIPNPDTSVDNVPMITGGIWSRGKFGFTYGRIEGRIKTNGWRGNFPAFWMMPEDQSGGWPNDGEIDIWEVIDAQERAYHTVHSNWTYNLGNTGNPQSSFNEYTPLDRYHVFTLEWDETSLVWFVDGKQVAQYYKSSSSDALNKGQWPFDDHFHIILNQSVGNGSWAANADVTHTYETLFDWVRVYQKKGMENTLGTVGIVNVVDRNPVKLSAVDGGVMVSTASLQDVVVYDIVGRTVAKAFVDACHTFYLPAGIYVIDGQKAVVK